MPYKWKTKFKLGDKVKLNYDGKVGIITQIEILHPDADLDYWEKVLPRLPNGKFQHTAYRIKFGDECHSFSERAITLVS